MILPTIALLSDSALANIPSDFLAGCAALGLSKWAMFRAVIIPSAKSGIFTGIILATGRAIGETMAILMVCGNIIQVPGNVFEPIRTLTANIALEMAYATGDHRSALFFCGVILMILVGILVSCAEYVGRGRIYA